VKTARLTVNLEQREYASLLALAKQEDVSIAWLIRRAIIEFLALQLETEMQPELPLARRATLTPRMQR
jgi:hypothetical protein